QIDVAVMAAVRAFSPLATEPQCLAVDGAFGNTRGDIPGHAARHPMLVDLGRRKIEADLGAVERILDADRNGDFVVAAADGSCGASPPAASGETREKIGEIHVVESG